VFAIHGAELWVALAVDVIAAVVGFALSETDRRRLGRTPWGLPSILWAVFWLVSWIIGLVLYLVAHRAEVRRAAEAPIAADAYGSPVAPMAAPRVSSEDFPAYPRPADGSVRQIPPSPPAPPPPPASPTSTGTDAAPPSWQPDPSGRYHYRWWTGTEWTSYVSTNGNVVVDTSPDQRIGPY
jgi:hypothetical protein